MIKQNVSTGPAKLHQSPLKRADGGSRSTTNKNIAINQKSIEISFCAHTMKKSQFLNKKRRTELMNQPVNTQKEPIFVSFDMRKKTSRCKEDILIEYKREEVKKQQQQKQPKTGSQKRIAVRQWRQRECASRTYDNHIFMKSLFGIMWHQH